MTDTPYRRKEVIGGCDLYLGDCLDVMPFLEKVDAVVADPPYGTTACAWDAVIDLDRMWEEIYNITIEDSAAIALLSSQPFTSVLVNSNIKAFKYEWVWEKSRSTGFLQSKYMPMKNHENVCIFVRAGSPVFNPQRTLGHVPTNGSAGMGHSSTFGDSKARNCAGGETSRNPVTVQRFKSERGFHPTQKPVSLMKYLIETYSIESNMILDFAMGSGTTGVACVESSRQFIGIEKEEEFFDVACERISKAERQGDLFREPVVRQESVFND